MLGEKKIRDSDILHVYLSPLQYCKVCILVRACLSVSTYAGSHDANFSHSTLAKKKTKKMVASLLMFLCLRPSQLQQPRFPKSDLAKGGGEEMG